MPGRFSHNKGQYSIIQMEAGHLRENPQTPQQEEAPQAITNAAKGLMGLILADAEREKTVLTLPLIRALQICLQNLCGQQQNSPMPDPTFGSKSGSQNGGPNPRSKRLNKNMIQLDHFKVHIWTQKWGQPLENFATSNCALLEF